jgi:M6 family metalloprotease-like protein
VTGTVSPWQGLSKTDTHYEGGANCNGICNSSKVGEFLKDTLDANDAAVDFGQYDSDGPDGVPNSGDDDGFVDFVAFVHAESGGECGTSNIWSHRWSYSGWTNTAYTTADHKAGGGRIKVDDYVIMPALACDGSTMIQIGVFAHEFGHAFGLPDLYDTDETNGDSEGIGNWCLMAGGSWGGDGASPEKPVHMSAWAKEFLGWVNPATVSADLNPASLESVEDQARVLKVPISATQWYLVENRQQKLFDTKLPAGGLLVWKINQTVVNSGLANNTVNGDENSKGVDLEEADGLAHLDAGANRGDAGDAFPGSSGKREFHNATNPASAGTNALCAISDSAGVMTAVVRVGSGTCAGVVTPTPSPGPTPGGGGGGGSCSGALVPPGGGPGGGGPGGLGLAWLLAPIGLAALLLLRRPREALG